MAEKAQDIMTSNPRTCREDDTVLDAVNVMQRADTGIVPVVDDQDRVIGVITDRDVCLRVVLDQINPEECLLEDVMTTDVVTCPPDADIEEVVRLMEQNKVRRMIIADQDNRVLGIISEGDIARELGQDLVGELVESVAQPGGPHSST